MIFASEALELTHKLQTAQANERYWMSRYDTVCSANASACEDLMKQRDAARKDAAEEKGFRVAFRAEAVTFREERDKAREALNYLTEHSKAELSRVIAERDDEKLLAETWRQASLEACSQRDEALKDKEYWKNLSRRLEKERDAAQDELAVELSKLKVDRDTHLAAIKERDETREQRDAMCDSAKFWENRFDVCGSQLKGSTLERNSLQSQLNAAREASKSFEKQANELAAQLKIVKNSAYGKVREPYTKSCGCKMASTEVCDVCQNSNAKQADATLDSLGKPGVGPTGPLNFANPNDFGAEPRTLDTRVSRLEHWLKDFVSVKKSR